MKKNKLCLRRIPSAGMFRRVTRIVYFRSVRRLLVTANVVPSSPNLVTLMNEELHSSETSVLTRATRTNISEDGIFHDHRRENLKPYIALDSWSLQRRRTVFLVRYELGFHIPEDNLILLVHNVK
jgi:hypothetical protein